MGSLDEAITVGIVCRLCSDYFQDIIHLYSERARHLRLLEKIIEYLPIRISLDDPLPKTICPNCLQKLEEQYKLVQQIERSSRLLRRERNGT